MLTKRKLFNSLLFLTTSSLSFANQYHLPKPNESLIGKNQNIIAKKEDSVLSLSKKYNIGFNAIKLANSQYLHLNKRLPEIAPLQIPNEHLLPNSPRKGIVINLPEMRMYYYQGQNKTVLTYPIGIGRINKTIPVQTARVIDKKTNPFWMPTKAIRQFNLNRGIVLPKIMPAGEDNPLGKYVVYMSIPTYLFHMASSEDSIGKRGSFGCIRMYDQDIAEFYKKVKKNTPIKIINQNIKSAWNHKDLYLEAHPALDDLKTNSLPTSQTTIKVISEQIKKHPALIDWQFADYLSHHPDGMPHTVGFSL